MSCYEILLLNRHSSFHTENSQRRMSLYGCSHVYMFTHESFNTSYRSIFPFLPPVDVQGVIPLPVYLIFVGLPIIFLPFRHKFQHFYTGSTCLVFLFFSNNLCILHWGTLKPFLCTAKDADIRLRTSSHLYPHTTPPPS